MSDDRWTQDSLGPVLDGGRRRQKFHRLDDVGLDLDALAKAPAEVAALSRSQREARVGSLVAEANSIVDVAVRRFVHDDGKHLAGIVGLFSGGNDSTVLAHVMRPRVTHFAHANTKVGIEQTREYVRKVCSGWGVPLLERSAPRSEDSYRTHVLMYGFPGPGAHFKMFHRLKARALEVVRNEVVGAAGSPQTHRVVFLAGRRRTESDRRNNVPELEREGSVVWVSPLVNWTKPDMVTYRLLERDVPVNEVADLCHMSGECLCGAFAGPGERAEIGEWYPGAFSEIAELEALLQRLPDGHLPDGQVALYERAVARVTAKTPDEVLRAELVRRLPKPKPIPEYAKRWGWGGDPEVLRRSRRNVRSGRLCASCDARWDAAGQESVVATAVHSHEVWESPVLVPDSGGLVEEREESS